MYVTKKKYKKKFFFTKPISDYGKMLKYLEKISVNQYVGRFLAYWDLLF